jgi:hypothetical protein
VSVCVDPGAGYSLTANDCDDADATIYPNSAAASAMASTTTVMAAAMRA